MSVADEAEVVTGVAEVGRLVRLFREGNAEFYDAVAALDGPAARQTLVLALGTISAFMEEAGHPA